MADGKQTHRNGQIAKLPDLAPVSRDTLTSQIHDQIRDGLMSGRYRPGEKLTIRGLAGDLGSSPMPVREALHRLHAEGAIQMSATGRVRVARLNVEQLREVRDARVALEGLLAEKATAHIDTEALSAIRVHFNAMQAAVDANEARAYLWSNFAFHRHIYSLAGSTMTMRIIEGLWMIVGPHFNLLTPDRDHLAASQAVHARIFDALAERDGAAARAAVTEDIMQAGRSLGLLLAERQSAASANSAV